MGCLAKSKYKGKSLVLSQLEVHPLLTPIRGLPLSKQKQQSGWMSKRRRRGKNGKREGKEKYSKDIK